MLFLHLLHAALKCTNSKPDIPEVFLCCLEAPVAVTVEADAVAAVTVALPHGRRRRAVVVGGREGGRAAAAAVVADLGRLRGEILQFYSVLSIQQIRVEQ